MKINTHYDNLKVARDASPDDIKRAFRKLTFQHHPDRNPPEHKALQERRLRIIKEAYDILSDPKRREAHDNWIRQQESTRQERGREEQNGNYDEDNTYDRNKHRQEMYYKALLEKERAINLTLRGTITQLETDLYNANALAQFLRNENNALKRRGGELGAERDQLKTHIELLAKIHQKTVGKVKRTNTILKWVALGACLLLCGQLTQKWLYDKEIDASVLAGLSEHVKRAPHLPPPAWTLYHWDEGATILTQDTEPKKAFVVLLRDGVLSKKFIVHKLQGQQAGSANCDRHNPASALNHYKTVNYRFVQLATNTVVSVTLPYSHLCKVVR